MRRLAVFIIAGALALAMAGRAAPDSSEENIRFCTVYGMVVQECLVEIDAFDEAKRRGEPAASHLSNATLIMSRVQKPLTGPPAPPPAPKPPPPDYCGRKNELGALVGFAIDNEGRFPSEMNGASRVYSFSVVDDQFQVNGWRFDDSEGRATNYGSPVENLLLMESCKPDGSFVGSNAVGVKRKVQRQRCMRVEISDALDKLVRPDSVDATPATFRDLKAGRYRIVVAFVPGEGVKGEVVERSTWRDAATVQRPVETDHIRLLVNGAVRQICLVSSRDGTRLAEVHSGR